MSKTSFTQRCGIALTALLLSACTEDPGGQDSGPAGCTGAKCDDPNTVAMDGCRAEQSAATADDEAIATHCEPGESASACGARVYTACREAAAWEHCEARRGEALECTTESRGSSFGPTAIRWQCADVSGVSRGGNFDASLPTADGSGRGTPPGEAAQTPAGDPSSDARGQEYCEYFALVQLPGEDKPREIGRLLSSAQTTQHDLSDELDDELRDLLDEEDDAVFGQCVFTSWHGDVNVPLEICRQDPAACEHLPPTDTPASWAPAEGLPFEISFDTMGMKGFLNSNSAALDLVDQCLATPEDHRSPPTLSAGIEDEFGRGCLRAYELFSTEWRRSDPAICTAAMRLRECGCGFDFDGDGAADLNPGDTVSGGRAAIARALLPAVNEANFLRGFPLGTWSDPEALPEGCRFVEISAEDSDVNGGQGEHGRNLVTCDITSERIESAGFTVSQAFSDMKTFCQSSYAQDVVVHVPLQGEHIPEATLVCDPPAGAANCEGMPIAVGAERGSQRAGLCETGME